MGLRSKKFILPRVYDPEVEAEVNLTVVTLKAHCAAMIAHYVEIYNAANTEKMKDYIAHMIETGEFDNDFENN